MLKRTVQAMTDAIGITTPNLHDAQAAAEQRRQALTDAQAAIDAASVALDAAHDAGVPASDIHKAEAALADARLTAGRAQLAYAAAERRLNAARDADADKAKATARTRLADALAIRKNAAANIDRLAAELAVQAKAFDSQIGVLNECARDGVATNDARTTSQRLIQHSLERVGALPSHWIGDPADQPSAVDLALRDQGAIVMPQAVAL